MTADPVHTLADLGSTAFPGTPLAVLGFPIRHSLSPAMHNAALADLARTDPTFASWHYTRFEVPPDDLPGALGRLHAAGFHGLNLTVPHKVIAFPCVAEVDLAARAIGAVNTLLRTAAGWRGANTDGYGLVAALESELGFSLGGAHVILLGAGGAARAAAVECLRRRCASLSVANRTPAHLDALLAVLRSLGGPGLLRGFDPAAPPPDLPAGALVINATSAGLRPGDPAPVDLARLPRPAAVFDLVYNPPETALLRRAAALGLPRASGLAMLAYQGSRALELWSGIPAARTAPAMRRAAQASLAAAAAAV